MKILRAEINGFGPFADGLALDFATDRINVVLGPNESGKSMLMKGIFAVIFGLSSDETAPCRSWDPHSDFGGEVTLAKNGTSFRIVRNFATGHAEIVSIEGDTEEVVFSGDATPGRDTTYLQELARVLGFQDGEIATSTTFITHRDMQTRVSEKLRQMISGSKRADYEKILEDLRREVRALTREDTGLLDQEDREISRLAAAHSAVDKALAESRELAARIQQLELETSVVAEQIERDSRTADGLSLLQGLLREEAGLQERLDENDREQTTVRNLQAELEQAEATLAQDYSAFAAFGETLLEDILALDNARRELARVEGEIEREKAARTRYAAELKKLQEELTSDYGAFEDLPDDFPEKLQLHTTRQQDLDALKNQLSVIDAQITRLDSQIEQQYLRFVKFGDDYPDRIKELERREFQVRQELQELSKVAVRVAELTDAHAARERQIQEGYADFLSVPEDFPSLLRSHKTVADSVACRTAEYEAQGLRMTALQQELREYSEFSESGSAYLERIDRYRAALQRVEADLPRLEQQRDEASRLLEERDSVNRDIASLYGHFEHQAGPDFPEKLREYHRLQEEQASKRQILQESEARLTACQQELDERFSRFASLPEDWGDRLEQHRVQVQQVEAALEKLRRDEQDFHETRRTLEALQAPPSADETIFQKIGDIFPEMLREYSRLRSEIEATQLQGEELKSTIKSLEQEALTEYSDFFGTAEDLGEKLMQFRTDRNYFSKLARELRDGMDAITAIEGRIRVLDLNLLDTYPNFDSLPEDFEKTVGSLQAEEQKLHALEAELESASAKCEEMEAQTRQGGLGGLMAGRTKDQRLRDLGFQEGRVTFLGTQVQQLKEELYQARAALGPLSEHGNLQALVHEYASYQNLVAERAQVVAQYEAMRAAQEKQEQAHRELEENMQRQMELLDLHDEADVEAVVARHKDYQALMTRLNSARRMLKNLQTPTRGEEGENLTDLQRSHKRLAELAQSLMGFGERVTQDADGVEAALERTIEGFRAYKKRQQEIQKLKGRLAALPDEKTIDTSRSDYMEQLTQEREVLGIAAGEPLDELQQQWNEAARLRQDIETERQVQQSHHAETVDVDGRPLERLIWLDRQVKALEMELGPLAHVESVDATLAQFAGYMLAKEKLEHLETALSNLPPLDDIEATERDIRRELKQCEEALGAGLDRHPQADDLEAAYRNYSRLLEEETLLAELLAQTEDAVHTMTATREQQLALLGALAETADVPGAIQRYSEYHELAEALRHSKEALAPLPSLEEVEATRQRLEQELSQSRKDMGLAPDEDVQEVATRHREYVKVRAQKVAEKEVRIHLMSSYPIPQGVVVKSPVEYLQQQLEELEAALGGFHDAGDATDDVISQFREAQRLKREILSRSTQLKKLKTQPEMDMMLAAAQEPIDTLEEKLHSVGALDDLEALRTRYHDYDRIRQLVSNNRRALEGHPALRDLKTVEFDLKQELQQAEGRVEALLAERTNLQQWRRNMADLVAAQPQYESDLSQLKTTLSETQSALEKARVDYQARMQPAAGPRGNLEVLNEQIRKHGRRQRQLLVQRDGLQMAIDLLESIVREKQETFVASLQIRATEILSHLTSGRYPRLRLEGTQLEPIIEYRNGTPIKGESLTGGLRDQLFFALRAAMAQEMSGKVSLPFILDDTFVQFDNDRLEGARKYLEDILSKNQVILLTHDERCRDWGVVALDLSRPRAKIAVEATA